MKTSNYFDLLKQELSNFPELAALASDINVNQDLLSKLTTPSKVAVWDLLTWVQASGLAACDAELQHTKDLILREIAKRKYGHPEWYVVQALLFQFGHQIIWTNGSFGYAEVDLEARIIAQAAVVPLAHGIRLKVARLVNEQLAPITNDQKEALFDYFNNRFIGIKPAGVRLVITTADGDLLKVYIRIKRNPQVLSANGSSILEPSSFPVIDAVNNYTQFLPFNGEFNVTELEDRLQAINGVEDVEIDSAQSKYGDFPYADIDMRYTADAGYMKIDPAFPLSQTIQYFL